MRRFLISAGMRRGDQAVIDAKRARNKHFANRLVTTVGRAGRRQIIFAVIHFTGRRSGCRYNNPFVLNLLANPGELQWQGRRIPVGKPTLIPVSIVTHLLPSPSRFPMWLDGTDTCVRIEPVAEVAITA